MVVRFSFVPTLTVIWYHDGHTCRVRIMCRGKEWLDSFVLCGKHHPPENVEGEVLSFTGDQTTIYW